MTTTDPYADLADWKQTVPEFMTGNGPERGSAFCKAVAPQFMDADWDDETPEIMPELMPVTGGVPLLYLGESHMIYGEAGSGKSWLEYLVAAQVAADGGVVLLADYESNRDVVKGRLKALGVTKKQSALIAYWPVDGSLMPGSPERRVLDEFIDTWSPAFIGLDSVGPAMGAAGLNENLPSDFTLWYMQIVHGWVAQRITNLLIDHTGHPKDDRKGTPAARGASSKIQRISGASYYFEALEPWAKDSDGRGTLTLMKDRGGERKKKSLAADVIVTVTDRGKHVKIELVAPDPDAVQEKHTPRYTWYMEAVCDLLATERDGLTASKVGAHFRSTGKSAGYADVALKTLVREGHVEVGEPGLRGARLCKVVKVYTAAWEDACVAAREAGEPEPEPPEMGAQW